MEENPLLSGRIIYPKMLPQIMDYLMKEDMEIYLGEEARH